MRYKIKDSLKISLKYKNLDSDPSLCRSLRPVQGQSYIWLWNLTHKANDQKHVHIYTYTPCPKISDPSTDKLV